MIEIQKSKMSATQCDMPELRYPRLESTTRSCFQDVQDAQEYATTIRVSLRTHKSPTTYTSNCMLQLRTDNALHIVTIVHV